MHDGFYVESSPVGSTVRYSASATVALNLGLPEAVQETGGFVSSGAKKRNHVRTLSRHPLAEQYAEGEVVVHVHLELSGNLDGMGEVDPDDRHLCLTYQWPQRPVHDLLDSKLGRFWRRAGRSHGRPDEGARDGDEVQGFVLISVPEFVKDPKRMTPHGRVPFVLPCVVRLRTLDDCTSGRPHQGQMPIGSLGPVLRALAVREADVPFAALRKFPIRSAWLRRVASHEIELLGQKIERAAEVVDRVADHGCPLAKGRIEPWLQGNGGEPAADDEAGSSPGLQLDPRRLLEQLRVILFDDDAVGVATTEALQGLLQASQVFVCPPQFRPRVVKARSEGGKVAGHKGVSHSGISTEVLRGRG